MNAKYGFDNGINYADFKDCYAGLAAMIFVQADVDLRSLNGKEKRKTSDGEINRLEIVNFLRGAWAAELAACLGLTHRELARYLERAAAYGR